LRAEEHDADSTKAIDAVVEKLVRQVRKFNGKRLDRKKRGTSPIGGSLRVSDYLPLDGDAADFGDADSIEDGAIGDEERLVRTKRFQMKPMIVDEAIDQMELVGHDFFLFQNADEDELNVLYRRRDGTYGILAPTSS
jgi:putative sigma-54 modulation protein